MQRNIHLLIIDPQNDFCDLPTEYQSSVVRRDASGVLSEEILSPSLAVPGAHNDMLRLGEFIRQGIRGLTDISVTLDSHHFLGIERPGFWMQADGSAVAPFTQILAQDVRSGKYLPRHPGAVSRVLQYLDSLEAAGRYTLMVWPVHCEIGSWGHNVHQDVRMAYNRWEELNLGVVNKITKGSNPWTEHYSALMAEVPDHTDPTTQLNTPVITTLTQSDLVLVAGEAGSHCVKATVEHLVQNFGTGSLSNIVLLTDCISAVGGFEQQYQDFLNDMRGKGLQLATTKDVLGDMIVNGRR